MQYTYFPFKKGNNKTFKHDESFYDERFYFDEIVIHSAEVAESIYEIQLEYPKVENCLNISFSLVTDSYKYVSYDFKTLYKCSFDASISEDEFMPHLIKFICEAYVWLYTSFLTLKDKNFLKIHYNDALNKEFVVITLGMDQVKYNASKAEGSRLKLNCDINTVPLPGDIEIHIPNLAINCNINKDSWFKKLLKRIKDVWHG